MTIPNLEKTKMDEPLVPKAEAEAIRKTQARLGLTGMTDAEISDYYNSGEGYGCLDPVEVEEQEHQTYVNAWVHEMVEEAVRGYRQSWARMMQNRRRVRQHYLGKGE